MSKIVRTDSGNNFPVGKTTKVVFTATDKAGNNAECSFTVTVKKQGKKFYLSCSAYLYNCNGITVVK